MSLCIVDTRRIDIGKIHGRIRRFFNRTGAIINIKLPDTLRTITANRLALLLLFYQLWSMGAVHLYLLKSVTSVSQSRQ